MYALKIKTSPYDQYYWVTATNNGMRLQVETAPDKIPDSVKTFDSIAEGHEWAKGETFKHFPNYSGSYYFIEIVPKYKRVLLGYTLGSNHVQE